MSVVNYNGLTVSTALAIHKFVIEHSGGLRPIVADLGKIESVLTHLQNDDYYPDFTNKVCHLIYGLNKNHAFNDGNKRASISISSFFLEINGHDASLHRYQRGMEEVVIWVAKSLIDNSTLKKIIEFLIYDRPSNVAFFISQAKLYRKFIEPQNAPIHSRLLKCMVDDWLTADMRLSEATLIQLFEVLPDIALDDEDMDFQII